MIFARFTRYLSSSIDMAKPLNVFAIFVSFERSLPFSTIDTLVWAVAFFTKIRLHGFPEFFIASDTLYF